MSKHEITEKEVVEAVREAGASSFSLDDSTPTAFTFSCRDHGDVLEEVAGAEDIATARAAATHLRERFPHANVFVECVDEWTHLTVKFPEPSPQANTELTRQVTEAICAGVRGLGFVATIASVRELDKETQVMIQTDAFIADFNPHGRSPDVPINAGPAPIMIFVPHSLPDDGDPLIKVAWATPATAKKLGLFQALMGALEKECRKPVPPLWSSSPYNTDIPAGAIKIGAYGYEGPWEHCPFYRLSDGSVLLVDGENKENIHIAKENVSVVIPILGDFFPALPEGAFSLTQAIDDITDELHKKITAEALEGSAETLKSFGQSVRPHVAADGSIHFSPLH